MNWVDRLDNTLTCDWLPLPGEHLYELSALGQDEVTDGNVGKEENVLRNSKANLAV